MWAVGGSLYADDGSIVLLSSHGFTMMLVIVKVCKEFSLAASKTKTETMCMPARGEKPENLEIKAVEFRPASSCHLEAPSQRCQTSPSRPITAAG